MARKWAAEARIRRFEFGGIEAMVQSWQYFAGPVYRLCELTKIVVGLSTRVYDLLMSTRSNFRGASCTNKTQ
jgi:hypothetical protein